MSSPPQSQCSGILKWQVSSSGTCSAKCYGLSEALHAGIDLAEHAQSRVKPNPAARLATLSCVGSAVYQHGAGKGSTTPPPACLGIEFLRYTHSVVQQPVGSPAQLPAAAHKAIHSAHQEQHLSAASRPAHDIELLHRTEDVQQEPQHSVPQYSSSTASNSGAAAAAGHPATTSSSSPAGSSPVEGPEYRGRPSLLARLQDLHAEVSERLEGQDPMWFGKAFASRAQLNWESMKSMAGQVVAAAKADLGLQQESEDAE